MTTLPYVIFNPGGYVPYGKDVEVSVFSTDPILAYQWLRDGVDIPGATAPTFVVKFGTPTSQIPNAIRKRRPLACLRSMEGRSPLDRFPEADLR